MYEPRYFNTVFVSRHVVETRDWRLDIRDWRLWYLEQDWGRLPYHKGLFCFVGQTCYNCPTQAKPPGAKERNAHALARTAQERPMTKASIATQTTCGQCGSALPVEHGSQFVTCEFCGTRSFVTKTT